MLLQCKSGIVQLKGIFYIEYYIIFKGILYIGLYSFQTCKQRLEFLVIQHILHCFLTLTNYSAAFSFGFLRTRLHFDCKMM
mgnify:CR=1 FL=1